MTRACVCVTSEEAARRAAEQGAPVVERRFDLFDAVPDRFVFDKSVLNIATFRGKLTKEAAEVALAAGADFLDIEENSPLSGVFPPSQVISSRHDFEGTPDADEILALFARLEKTGLPKAAFFVHDAGDLVSIARAAKELRKSGRPFILIGMGECGRLTRICAERLGSFLNYCYIDEPVAPGQPAFSEVKPYDYLCAVCGWPLAHTLSPAIHNAAFKAANLSGYYLKIPCRPENVCLLPELMDSYGMTGLNITIPLKQAVIPYLHELSPEARKAGAVNTVTSGLFGYNTDISGIAAVMDRFSPKGKRVLLIGAGGAARAAAVYCRKAGADLTITNRTAEKAAALAEEFGAACVDIHEAGTYDLYINATPAPPLCEIPCGAVYFDMKYGSAPGLGRDMLIAQAADSFKIWTGRDADIRAMYNAAEDAK